MKERRRCCYAHIDLDMRKVIESTLDEGKAISAIAKRLEVDPTSVSREIKRNRRCEGISTYKTKNRNDCAHYRDCKMSDLCGNGCRIRYCKCCKADCVDICADYEKLACKRLARAPHVCNGCGDINRCALERYRCSANAAEMLSASRAREPREGLSCTSEELAEICCHANSTVRKGCGNATPFALAKAVFPQRLFDELGLEETDPEHVIGVPGVLYGG